VPAFDKGRMAVKTKIYVLCEPSGEIRYVGKTIRLLGERLRFHLYEARKGVKNHRCNWIRSLFSKGFLPISQLIGEVEGNGSREEIAWIKYFRDEGLNLVNETDGGEGTLGCRKGIGHIVSSETRAKLSVAEKGSRNHFFGKHHSPETLAKMSMALKGRRNPLFGKHRSPETRAKLSAANKGRRPSSEARAKMSVANKNWRNAKKSKTQEVANVL